MGNSEEMPPPPLPQRETKKRKLSDRASSASVPVSVSASASASESSSVSASASVAVSRRQTTASSTSTTRSSAFSDSAKSEIKRFSQQRCFACDRSFSIEAAHVIQKHDSSVALLRERGLLVNFNVSGVENGVALCPLCYAAYDRDHDPGFIFWPSDLDFFIEREIEYRKRDVGNAFIQRVPSAREYANYIGGGLSLGLYRRFFLEQFVDTPNSHTSLVSLNASYAAPVPWHGVPFAALRRAFAIISSPRVNVIPLELENKLVLLKNLYYRDEFNVNDIPRTIPTKKLTLSYDETTQQRPFRLKEFAKREDQVSSSKEEQWILGPSSTSQHAIEIFGPAIEAAAAFSKLSSYSFDTTPYF